MSHRHTLYLSHFNVSILSAIPLLSYGAVLSLEPAEHAARLTDTQEKNQVSPVLLSTIRNDGVRLLGIGCTTLILAWVSSPADQLLVARAKVLTNALSLANEIRNVLSGHRRRAPLTALGTTAFFLVLWGIRALMPDVL